MSEKKFVIYYHEIENEFFYMYSSWFDINIRYLKPILYSDNFELIKKVTNELNEQL